MNAQTAQRTSLSDLQRQAPATTKPSIGMREIVTMPRAQQFPKMLEAFKKEIAVALPSHLNADRMARIALTCFRQTPALQECEPQSVFACIVMASQLGLEPGLMGQAYLIPFNKKVKEKNEQGREVERWVKECQLIPGYQGLVDLARRSGRIKSLEAHVVYENDHFECNFGINPVLKHEPKWDGERGGLRLAYAVAHLADGGVHVEVMTRAEILAIRDRSQNVQNAKKWNKKTPWDTDEPQMWIKTVLRRICKFLPKSVELASAIALDAINARGRSQEIDLSDVIEGDYTHIASGNYDDEGEFNDQGEGDTGPGSDEQGAGNGSAQADTAHDSGAAGASPSPASTQATAAPESHRPDGNGQAGDGSRRSRRNSGDALI